MRAALTLAVALVVTVSLVEGGVYIPTTTNPPPAPLFRDPVFDGAHDGEFVWHEGEKCWWLTYLQNRFNSPLVDAETSPDKHLFEGTDFGLASTPDHGRTWVYRGTMRGLDLPTDIRGPGDTLQYGGSTWWRPAVTTLNGVYHGYFVYRPTYPAVVKGCVEQCIVHYTSSNLVDWQYQSIIGDQTHGQAPGYDSVVRQIADGRWILMSTQRYNPNPDTRIAWESKDLYTWQPCTTPSINEVLSYMDEGPHITTWQGHMWLNFDGQDGRNPDVARSDDGGVTWVLQKKNIFSEFSMRPFDGVCTTDHQHCEVVGTQRGAAHQGPLLPQGNRMFALYLVEFTVNTNGTADLTHLHNARSMLQVGEVVYDPTTKELSCDRSRDFDFQLTPPTKTDTNTHTNTNTNTNLPTTTNLRVSASEPVWSIAASEARLIALAEFNRWHAGWYPLVHGVTIDWRNPDRNSKYFTSVTSSGQGADTQWTLVLDTTVPSPAPTTTPGERLQYTFVVDGRGSIVSMTNAATGQAMGPLRQYRYDGPVSWVWAG